MMTGMDSKTSRNRGDLQGLLDGVSMSSPNRISRLWVIHEVSHSRASQTVQEFAANVLESARAQNWDDLGPSWVDSQHLPPALKEKNWQKLPGWRGPVWKSPLASS
jgi:hypothetical protein